MSERAELFKRPMQGKPLMHYCKGDLVPIFGTTIGTKWSYPTCSKCYERVRVVW